jgi:uncharacterized protein YjbI with pentapeptide repeats
VWAPPTDPVAARRIEEWRAGAATLQAIGLDLRGTDLSDLDLGESWFTAADLRAVRFVGSDLYATDMEDADLTSAVLTRARLGRARFDGARLVSAELDREGAGAGATEQRVVR